MKWLMGHLRLFDKAVLLLLWVTAFFVIEVAAALWFKDDLKADFEEVARFDHRERDYLFGLVVSAEFSRDLALPAERLVFVRVNHWLARLRDLGQLEEQLPLPRAAASEFTSFKQALTMTEQILRGAPSNEELSDFASRLRKTVDAYAQELHHGFTDIRTQRARLAAAYGEKSDLYAWVLLVIGLSGFAIVVVAGGIFITGLVSSLQQLEGRAKEITAGAYGPPLKTDRRDEVGLLVRSINTMAQSLEQREKEVEEFRRRLFQQEKMFTIGSFAAGIAHEVGNPIQAIMALTTQVGESLAESADEEDGTARENLGRIDLILAQIDRLGNVVQEIREFAHPGSVESELIDLNQVVATTINLMRFDRRFKRVALAADLAPGLPAVPAVADHLTQVLINLLTNAVDAVDKPEGRIAVRTRQRDSHLFMVVSDNGKGMTVEEKTRATEPFFTTKEKGRGTGLGLSVCKHIVDEHDGILEIDSVPGEGTTISIGIPVAGKPPSKRTQP